ncbi:DUF4129 domain-containing protein [Nocardia alni]|uniref:DUF4129 domain-containing protein n=1 Tax=Nocardia alni TaxID=2815723 RepID=UPI001C21CEA3|nr:DUF4129 domain-containing protein [Nocardia alni]
MIRVGTAVPRAIVAIALVVLAVLALRGYLPGGSGPRAVSAPTTVSVALMPVLSLVSIVILLAGVITSQHRLPLALPDAGRRRERRSLRLGRIGLIVVAVLAAVALVAAVGWLVHLVLGGYQLRAPQSPTTSATPSQAPPSSIPAPHPAPGQRKLSGGAMLLIGVTAGALVAVALAGLVAVVINTRRRPVAQDDEFHSAGPESTVSLVQVAEMGLAAMIASGQDARTAIIACYVAMERGLAAAREVAPLISDTPSEVLARAFDRGALRDASARELVTLFEEARFSPHSMLEWQRMRAEQLLRIALRDLRGETQRGGRTTEPSVSGAPS